MPISQLSLSRRWAVPCTWLVLALLAPALHGARKEEYAGESAKWRRYQSPHFELFSANNDVESRTLLHNLELLRAFFFDAVKMAERQPLEVTIYYFDDKKDFFKYVRAPLRQNKNLGGYYMTQPDRATIVVSSTWDDESARHMIFHEYIHHLMRVTGEHPPVWYGEGVAELYSSMVIKSDTLEFGRPLPRHVFELQQEGLLPLETLFSVDHSSPLYNTGKHTGQFYAESWALLHYWYYGDSKLDRAKVGAFIDYVSKETTGGDPAARRKRFQETIGMDYPAMQQLLEKYVRNGRYNWTKRSLPQIPNAKSYERRELTLEEIRERLTELDLRANQSSKARLAFLEAADRSSVKARTWEVLGMDAMAQGEANLARERWERALENGSTNPAIYHELGLIEGRRWFGRFDFYFRLPDDRAAHLRKLLKRSIECAPKQTDAYEMLAWVEATAAKPDIANVNVVQRRFGTLKNKGRTLVGLAMVRVHLNEPAEALAILNDAAAFQSEPAVAEVTKIIRAHLQPASGH